MRTTLVLDDDLLRKAKIRAATENLTLSEVVNRALRGLLQAPTSRPGPFQMVVYGAGLPTVHHEPGDMSDLLEAEDAADG